jgi:glycosyltransferase involved in cell wall biosynthesis
MNETQLPPTRTVDATVVWFRTGTMHEFGGAESVTLYGLRRLRQRGIHTTLLLDCPSSSDSAVFFSAHHPDCKFLSFQANAGGNGWITRIGAFLRQVRELRRFLKTLDPEFIIANSEQECILLWVYSLGGLIPLPPIVSFVHGSPFQFADDPSKYMLAFGRHFSDIRESDSVYRDVIPADRPAMGRRARIELEISAFIKRSAVRLSRLVFVLSKKNLWETGLLYGMKRIYIACPGGYDQAYIEAPPPERPPELLAQTSSPIIFSLCRLISKKRVDLVLRSFAALLEREPQPKATLVIGGAGAQMAFLRNLTTDLGISARVVFVGFIPDEELRAWYSAADIFVSADNADYDLTVMRALAHGKNIVVSNQYSIPGFISALIPSP